MDDGDNLSDHLPVSIGFPFSVNRVTTYISHDDPSTKYNWKAATTANIEFYQQSLDNYLDNIVLPKDVLKCKDFFCECHTFEIKELHDNLVKACIQDSELSIPVISSKCQIPGWNDHVKAQQQT